MFGTSGIRGLYGKEVTEILAYQVAHAFAGMDIVVARDTRRSNIPLLHAVVSGALGRGVRVTDAGVIPTPTLALATQKHRARGLMLTASHNPEEYAGIKLLEDGKEISREQEKDVERAMGEGKFYGRWDLPGTLESDGEIAGAHIRLVRSLVDEKIIAKKNPKVIIDCNGAGAAVTPRLLTDIGCKTIALNAGLSGFNRLPEPTAENLKTTCKIVRAVGASFGIAHDGDADRAVLIDEHGELLGLDVQLALAIEQELEHSKNKKVLTTVEASLLVRETIERLGGKYEILPVGSTALSHRLTESGAVFAGEPCGEYIYAKGIPCPDGILVAARFAQLFAERGSLAVLKKKFTLYPMVREKFKCGRKTEAMEKIKQMVAVEGDRNEQDGLRIDEEDGWFLIRASGTEPAIRLTAEYKNKKKLEERAEKLRKIIQNATGSVNPQSN